MINERKKLQNLRRLIKESIKEYLGDKFNEAKHGSSDEDPFNMASKKKKKPKPESR